MSNSPLVDYVCLSPHMESPRESKIDRITIHHMAGDFSVEVCGNIFQNPERRASSNYSVGTDGRIGMYVEEGNRSFCSSSPENTLFLQKGAAQGAVTKSGYEMWYLQALASWEIWNNE